MTHNQCLVIAACCSNTSLRKECLPYDHGSAKPWSNFRTVRSWWKNLTDGARNRNRIETLFSKEQNGFFMSTSWWMLPLIVRSNVDLWFNWPNLDLFFSWKNVFEPSCGMIVMNLSAKGKHDKRLIIAIYLHFRQMERVM